MPNALLFDTGPLGLLAHDRQSIREPIQNWLVQEMTAGATVYLSEVADYELRRELIRLVQANQMPASRIARLDQLASLFTFLPVSTSMWKRAAEMWADARKHGKPTADPAALDADVLIAAQAEEIQATVLTTNPGHLAQWVAVRNWPI